MLPAATSGKGFGAWPELLCHFSLWYGLVFATPVFVAAHNLLDLALPLSTIAGSLMLACMVLTGISYLLGRLLPATPRRWLAGLMLAMALLSALQGNIVSDLFYYGAFNGESMQFRSHGWLFKAEWLAYLIFFLAVALVLLQLKTIPVWLPLLPIVSFSFLLLPLIGTSTEETTSAGQFEAEEVDPSVFAFSSIKNLLHLLPDGLQGGLVQEIFEQNPGLAKQFDGYTLYTNHLGLYQATAPAMFTLMTGEPFDLEKGHGVKRVLSEFAAKAYPLQLKEQGFQLDYVPIIAYVCPEEASSCYLRPFNDMKARGYFRHHNEDIVYSFRLVADLSLFRLLPMYLKEKIYDNGHWFISDTMMDGSSPWPDPVIHEWQERMYVVDDRPVYKWYHYIGGHIPPHWNSDCQYRKELPMDRASYLAQTYCVLRNIGQLNLKLKELGIYDQTAILVSSDHGHNTVPAALDARPLSGGLSLQTVGTASPTLLIKNLDQQGGLAFDSRPTSLVDVAPTALAMVGIESDQASVFDIEEDASRRRYYTPISIPKLWSGESIPYSRYQVDGALLDTQSWQLADIQPFAAAPSEYKSVNFQSASGFVEGLALDQAKPDREASWIIGSQVGFILNLETPASAQSLQLTLHLPDWIPEQDFSVSVNSTQIDGSFHIAQDGPHWQTVDVPLPAGVLRTGNNLFSVVFESTFSPAERKDWFSAGLLKSIRID